MLLPDEILGLPSTVMGPVRLPSVVSRSVTSVHLQTTLKVHPSSLARSRVLTWRTVVLSVIEIVLQLSG